LDIRNHYCPNDLICPDIMMPERDGTEAEFSHSIYPEYAKELYPEFSKPLLQRWGKDGDAGKRTT